MSVSDLSCWMHSERVTGCTHVVSACMRECMYAWVHVRREWTNNYSWMSEPGNGWTSESMFVPRRERMHSHVNARVEGMNEPMHVWMNLEIYAWMEVWLCGKTRWMHACMNEGMNLWMSEWMSWMHEWLSEQVNSCMHSAWMSGRWIHACMSECMNEWTSEFIRDWAHEWLKKWIHACISACMSE